MVPLPCPLLAAHSLKEVKVMLHRLKVDVPDPSEVLTQLGIFVGLTFETYGHLQV